MILIFNLKFVPRTDHDLNLYRGISTGDKYDVSPNLYLGIVPGPDHDLKTCSAILHL